MNKKAYIAPESVAYRLESGMLCETSDIKYSKQTVSDNTKIGFSKGFSGGVEDDDAVDLWKEE